MSPAGPLVSVVLATRNRPHRLNGSVASVLAQSYPHFELLVVDDASTVPAEPVVDRVAGGDTRVKLIRLDKHSGAAAARNTALKHASGDIVAFIDDDDQWTTHKLERQMRYFADHPDVGIITAHFEVVDERRPGQVLTHRVPTLLSSHHLFWFNLPGCFVCGAARKDVVDADLWQDESFPSVEDWDMWARCGRHTSIGVVEEVLGRHTLHSDGQLSDPAFKLRGLQAFEARHAASLSKACLAFLRAHQRMEIGTGWRKRANVLRSLATDSPRASALLLIEQTARQVGKLRDDPGLAERVLARAIASE